MLITVDISTDGVSNKFQEEANPITPGMLRFLTLRDAHSFIIKTALSASILNGK